MQANPQDELMDNLTVLAADPKYQTIWKHPALGELTSSFLPEVVSENKSLSNLEAYQLACEKTLQSDLYKEIALSGEIV
jgi:hypothetical protein